jgi:hypothetical protein
MCFSGTSRACPEFCFTEEEIKKFVGKLRIATKQLLGMLLRILVGEKRSLTGHYLKLIKDICVLL